MTVNRQPSTPTNKYFYNFIKGIYLHFAKAGHLVMGEFPKLVNQAIANWLKVEVYN
ncbi:MAG: hypothetical protein HEQ35_16870 [Gloeotrichia echinulata IR180]|nr:hypothetical protein [Gloeotrichia echinulata DEX184]